MYKQFLVCTFIEMTLKMEVGVKSFCRTLESVWVDCVDFFAILSKLAIVCMYLSAF